MEFFRNNGLSLVLLVLFLGTWVGQAVSGWHEYNDERQDHGQASVGFAPYLGTGHFLEATGENWESEFLQMGMFVLLTKFLFQKGSPESHDPDEGAQDDAPVTRRSPWPVRAGGVWLVLYRHSLTSAFLLLFIGSFVLHAVGGHLDYNEDRRLHGMPPETMEAYLETSRFWFESMQNWQSEFLSLLAMVFLSVYLREVHSAESKPVALPHGVNEE